MTGPPPLVEFRGIAKHYGSAVPLRIVRFAAGERDRVALAGLTPPAAELFIHLVCGAALPDEGEVLIDGQATRDLTSATDWLRSLDRFGLVSRRGVLLDAMSVQANLAMPLTLSVDTLAAAVLERVRTVAADVGLDPRHLEAPVATLGPLERLRVHLGRALVAGPRMVLLEHPTAGLEAAGDRASFGRTLRAATAHRQTGWLAVTDDEEFRRASGSVGWRVRPSHGDVRRRRGWLWR